MLADRIYLFITVICLAVVSWETCNYLFPIPPLIPAELKNKCECYTDKAILTNPLEPLVFVSEPNEAQEFKRLSVDQATRDRRRDEVLKELRESFTVSKNKNVGLSSFEWYGRHRGFRDALDIVVKEKQEIWLMTETNTWDDVARFKVEPL